MLVAGSARPVRRGQECRASVTAARDRRRMPEHRHLAGRRDITETTRWAAPSSTAKQRMPDSHLRRTGTRSWRSS